MKINDFIFRHINPTMINPGIFRVRTFVNSKNEIYVVLSELDENPSSSVTNEIENIVEDLIYQNKIPNTCKIIEHYSDKFSYYDFSLVTFDSNMKPSWKTISLKKVLDFLECTVDEFDNYKNDERVMQEIKDALLSVPKLKEFKYSENPDITERRLEIMSKQHKKDDIINLLNTSPNEQVINKFLREDLSLIAECYAFPDEEYICFAEFPVGEHRVDFALFTGRSRMRVYLIEIKGANKAL